MISPNKHFVLLASNYFSVKKKGGVGHIFHTVLALLDVF